MDTGRALRVLDLRPGYDEDDVARAYRRRAASTHPDRGGDAGAFHDTLEARDALMRQLRLPRAPVVVVDDARRWTALFALLGRRERRAPRHLL